MESGGPQHSLLASKVYVSFLLTPNSNVLSLFTPMAYFAPSAMLLRIVHRVHHLVKRRGEEGQGQGPGKGDDEAIVHTVSEILVMALESCGNSSNYNKSCSLCSEILTFVVNKMAMDSDEIRKCLLNFSKYLVCKAPERAELRALAVESILEIVKALEHKDQIDFVDYVVNMTRGKPQLRLLGADLIHSLIMSLDDPLGASLENGYESSWGFNCLQALVERCSDATEHGLLLIWHN
ncbi:condensin-2 complex subunit D3 [Tanacetum coccineum]